MKRTALALCLLALATSCRNKRTLEADAEPKDSAKTAEEAPQAKPTPAAKQAKPPQQKKLPPPSDVAAPPASAKKSKSGLAWTVLEPGKGGDKPTAKDKVEVDYTGWTADGEMFDSSVTRGRPSRFGVGQVIAGWTEGLQLMTEGEKRRFWIPADLAYGEKPRPGAPAGQLTFDVKLLKIFKTPEPPTVPKDVAAPPATAKKTASGLAYVVLKPGKGKKPSATSRVTVHYSGWTADGKMFDSSVTRGEPATFPLNGVIKGWTEGLQLMKEGAKYRFWIPGPLAYGDKAGGGRPSGQLTFDVELLQVQ